MIVPKKSKAHHLKAQTSKSKEIITGTMTIPATVSVGKPMINRIPPIRTGIAWNKMTYYKANHSGMRNFYSGFYKA
jgi:hypothetical protein